MSNPTSVLAILPAASAVLRTTAARTRPGRLRLMSLMKSANPAGGSRGVRNWIRSSGAKSKASTALKARKHASLMVWRSMMIAGEKRRDMSVRGSERRSQTAIQIPIVAWSMKRALMTSAAQNSFNMSA
ncbi:MAG: hypothetical protein CMH89_02420 [Oceanicaulis sp.]|nr:hypothetical protein [Oceanicaulis sp.]